MLPFDSLSGTYHVLLGNGQGFTSLSIGSTQFNSLYRVHTTLTLKNFLLVPDITKNIIPVSKYAKDNNVLFEFHFDKFLVKSQVSSKVVPQGSLNKYGLYSFGFLQLFHTTINTLTGPSSSQHSVSTLGPSLYTIWDN